MTAASWPDRDRVPDPPDPDGRAVADIPVGVPLDTVFSPDGSRLAVSSQARPGSVLVFDARSGTPLVSTRVVTSGHPRRRVEPRRPVDRGRVGPTDSAHVYAARTGRLRFTTPGNIAVVNGVDWSPDSTRLAVASNDGTVRITEVGEDRDPRGADAGRPGHAQRRTLGRLLPGRPPADDLRLVGHLGKDLGRQPHGGGRDRERRGGTYVDGSAVFTRDGRSVYVPDPGGTVSRWNVTSGARTQRLPAPSDADGNDPMLALSPDGHHLAVNRGLVPGPGLGHPDREGRLRRRPGLGMASRAGKASRSGSPGARTDSGLPSP